MKFREIPQLTNDGNYAVNQPWDSIEGWIQRQIKNNNLDLDPDFQRAHVWTEKQQKLYVQHCLRGGKESNRLRFNCAGWMGSNEGPFVIVDGKQRLEAVRKFLRNELKAFGNYYQDFEDKLPYYVDFIISINDLKNRRDILNWYLEINTGGVAHTEKEIGKVKMLLEEEIRKQP